MPKISQLPPTPLSIVGNELAIINQNGNTYSSVLSNFTGGGSNVSSLSANWQNTYTTVQANSATNWNYQGTDLKSLSANWQNTYTTVQANSATNWNYQGTDLKSLSANWQNTYTTVQANSATWAIDNSGSNVTTLSANWQNTYTTVQANSATNWNYQGTDLKSLSANWQNTYTTVQANSGNWTNSYTTTQANSARWSSVYNTVYALSAAWEESAEILPTVTEYLSTNNVRLSSVTMSGNINLSGNNLLNASLIRGVSGSPPSFPDGLKAVGGSTCFLPPSGGNLLSESVPYNAGTFTSSNILLNRANGNMQKLTLSTSTTFTLSAPLNGSEGRTLTARISCGSGSDRSITFDTPILKPSDSGITFPKTLTSGKTYITKLYYNGAAWELITLIGGYD